MNRLTGFILLGAALAVTPVAQADGPYLGAGIGQSSLEGLDEICGDLTGGAAIGFAASCRTDDGDTSLSLFGGYQFSRFFAVELGYIDFGEGTIDAGISANGNTASLSGTISLSGVYVAAVGMLPLGDRFSLMAKAGVFGGTAKGDAELRLNGVVVETEIIDDDGGELLYGFGGELKVSENVGLRLMYQRVDTEEPIDSTSLALIGHF